MHFKIRDNHINVTTEDEKLYAYVTKSIHNKPMTARLLLPNDISLSKGLKLINKLIKCDNEMFITICELDKD